MIVVNRETYRSVQTVDKYVLEILRSDAGWESCDAQQGVFWVVAGGLVIVWGENWMLV